MQENQHLWLELKDCQAITDDPQEVRKTPQIMSVQSDQKFKNK